MNFLEAKKTAKDWLNENETKIDEVTKAPQMKINKDAEKKQSEAITALNRLMSAIDSQGFGAKDKIATVKRMITKLEKLRVG